MSLGSRLELYRLVAATVVPQIRSLATEDQGDDRRGWKDEHGD